MAEISKRQQIDILRTSLENERSSFITHWRDLSDFIQPRRARFTVSDVNKGDRRNQKIIDSTGSLSVRTLRSGMMSGITSPARPWFRLTTPDPKLAEYGSVKEWLYTVDRLMSTVFLRSNLYNVLPIVYGDLGVFATSAIMVEEDFDDVVRFYPFPIGSYCIANNDRLKVDTFYRKFRMTVRQVVNRYGQYKKKSGAADWANISDHVKNMYDKANYSEWVDICHVIQPNTAEYDESKLAAKHKKYSSCTFEEGTQGSSSYMTPNERDAKFLRESGYNYFPVLAPRWEVTGEDSYGTDCPGMCALGDIKALQVMQKRKAQAVEKMVNPPMVGPNLLKKTKASIIAGEVTYLDERDGQKMFRPAHEVNPRVQELLLDIQDHQGRIRRAFYEDLFLMIANDQRREVTAREIEERHEEKLLALGPVLEQLNQDLLDPLIDNTYEIMERQGMIPPPPQELKGQKLKVEYVSIMAQAQKLVGLGGIERFMSFCRGIAESDPELAQTVKDKVDFEQSIDIYADQTSIPPGMVRPDEDVQKIKQGREQAQKAAQAAEVAKQAAGAAKDLSQADMGGDNALTRMIDTANAGNLVPAVA